MSVQTQIERISNNVQSAFNALKEKGVTVPSGATSDDLSGLIGQTASQADVDNLEEAALISTHLTAIAAGDGALPIDVVGNAVKYNSGGAVLGMYVKVSDRIPTISDLQRGYAIGFSVPEDGAPISAFEPIGTGEYNYSFAADAFNASVETATYPGCILFGIGAGGLSMPGGLIVSESGAEIDGVTLTGGVYLLVYASAFRISGFDWSENGAVYSDTLTWDGDTTGLESVTAGDYTWYRVSSETPSASVVANGGTLGATQSTGAVQSAPFASSDVTVYEGGGCMISLAVIVAPYDGWTVPDSDPSLVIPKAGIYFADIPNALSMRSLSITGYQFKIVPATVRSVNGVKADEDGNVQIETGLPTTVQVSDIAAFAAEKASDGTFANPEGLYTNLNNGQYVRFTIQDDSTGGRAVMWFTSQAAETLGSLEIWLISEPGATPSLWLRISNDDGCEFAGAHFLVALTQIMSDEEKATFKSNLGIA